MVELRDSLGNLITGSNAGITWQPGSAGAYVSFGDGTMDQGGTKEMEAVPMSHRFRLTYQGLTKTKQQNIGTNPVVSFVW